MEINLSMTQTKQTKGTVVFTEIVDEDVRPHTFYILKDTFEALGSPESLIVTLTSTE